MLKYFVLFMVVLTSCSSVVEAQSQPRAVVSERAVETIIETATTEPTATTGYQATTEAAQATTVSALQTASAAIAQQVEATNAHEAREFGLVQMTQDADHATQTAAPTSIQLTATQQVAENTLIAKHEENISGALTATKEAPAQVVAIARADSEARVAPLRASAEAIGPLCNGMVMLVIGVLVIVVLLKWRNEKPPEKFDENMAMSNDLPYPQTPVAVTHIHEHNDDSETIRRILPPLCDPEVFREWAVYALGGESIAVGSWETKDSPFQGREYRDVFYPWVIENGLKINKADGTAILSKRGIAYCKDWIMRHPLSPASDYPAKTAPLFP